MRIKRISVTNLFGMFNHIIDLNMNERITIIHGLNGVGKTAILRLVDAVINRQAPEILSIPFQEFKIEFDNNSYFVVSKNLENIDQIPEISIEEENQIEFIWHQRAKKNKTWNSVMKIEPSNLPFPISYIDRMIPELTRTGSRTWNYMPTGEMMTLDTVLARFGHRIPLPGRFLKMGWPDWIDECLSGIQVRFVRAQRLLLLPSDIDEPRYRDEERRPRVSEAVLSYSTQLRDIIRQKLAESSVINQSLDSTFPQRVINSYRRGNVIPQDELLERLESNEKKRSFLISVGLYDRDKEKIQIPEVDDEHIRRVLSVYVQDVETKLGIFDELADKINLLVNLINDRFNYKKMEIDKEKGFVFRTDGRLLSPANLSSGEQHELVLTYELLFQTTKDTLVLIDEPELSLHVGWQIRFLDDLERIINLAQIDTLVATHSPQIINNRWDITVQLGTVEE
jgi:predicted ATP-binding protein involved in virulence